jgi:integrase
MEIPLATLRKKGNRWQAQIRRKGHASITKSFLLKADAQEWVRYIEQQMDRKSLPYDPKALDGITLKSLLEKYRDEVIPKKRSPEREINIINYFLSQEAKLIIKPLSEISATDFCIYRDKRMKVVKPATVCRALGLLQHAYDIAKKEWNYPILENPLTRIKKPEIRNRRERRLTWSELRSLINALDGCLNEYIKPLTLFALNTAMRRGEILAAKWSDLRLEEGLLSIPLTKNGYSRTIPLNKRARRILEELKGKGTKPSDNIFPVSEEGFRMAWRRVMDRSGIIDLHFHDLRHEAISRFFERGLSVPEVALISGHRDFRMLFRYTHLKAEDIAKKINN